MFLSIMVLLGGKVKCIGVLGMVTRDMGWKYEVKYGMEVMHLPTSLKVARWTMIQCVCPLMDDKKW